MSPDAPPPAASATGERLDEPAKARSQHTPRVRPSGWLNDRDTCEAVLVEAAVWHGVALPPDAAAIVRDPIARQVLETLAGYEGPDPLRHLDESGVPALELVGLWRPPWPWTFHDAVQAALHRLRARHAQDCARGDLVAALDELDRGDLDAAARRLTAAGRRIAGTP